MYWIGEWMAIIAFIVILTSCEPVNKYLGLQDDNLGEEMIEAAIKIETGADIDFTPSSKE